MKVCKNEVFKFFLKTSTNEYEKTDMSTDGRRSLHYMLTINKLNHGIIVSCPNELMTIRSETLHHWKYVNAPNWARPQLAIVHPSAYPVYLWLCISKSYL